MKRVLILGGSHRDIPLIKASKELGYFVITLGDRDYYLGHKYSDKAIKINFNNLDKVKDVIKDENIDYIIPGSGEESYINTVKLSHELGMGNFDDIETAKLVHNKWKFKNFCLDNKISTPNGLFYKTKKDLEKLKYPIVVKPTTLSGGRGVNVVNNEKELWLSLNETMSLSEEVFLEEFISGTLIAYSVIINDKKVHYGFVGEDKTFLNKYLITSAYKLDISEKCIEKLKKDVETISSRLNLVNGMFHLQVLIKDDLPYIIDVTRRIPGDLYPYLIEYSDKIEYSKAVIQSYTTGNIVSDIKACKESDFIIRHCVMPSKNGVYKKLYIDDSLKDNIIYRLDLVETNINIEDFLHMQIAIVFVKIDDISKKEEIIENINNLIYPIIEINK